MKQGLRIVAMHYYTYAWDVVKAWADRHGHEIVLLVTSPGPSFRRNTTYRELVAHVPARQEVAITTRMKRLVPYLASLKPDLVISYTFPLRIPAEVRDVPTHGAINLHPSTLPLYRGPNPFRMFYDDAEFGATVHWTAEDYDTGAILGRSSRAMPEAISAQQLFTLWHQTCAEALEDGARAAIAGETGRTQDDAAATHSPHFEEEERHLDFAMPARVLIRRSAALKMCRLFSTAEIEGRPCVIDEIEVLEATRKAEPGTVLGRWDNTFARWAPDTFAIQAADAVVRVSVRAPS